jgi:hypothetical protein
MRLCVNSSYKISYLQKNIINSLTVPMLRMLLNIETYNVHKQISNYIVDAFVSGHAYHQYCDNARRVQIVDVPFL